MFVARRTLLTSNAPLEYPDPDIWLTELRAWKEARDELLGELLVALKLCGICPRTATSLSR